MKCPLTKEECLESEVECPWWVKLIIDKQEQGRCAIAWSAILLVELRQQIERTNKQLEE